MENRAIDPHILDFMPELLKVYCNLYSAICKYTYLRRGAKGGKSSKTENEDGAVYTYRDDRWHTCLCMLEGESYSFLSTTKNQRESVEDGSVSYFQKKDGLVLLECDASDAIEYLDINDVLREESVYPDEDEILFPPFLYCDMETLEMTEADLKLKDIQGDPPRGKFRAILKGSTVAARNPKETKVSLEELQQEVLNPEAILNAKTVWETLKKHKLPAEDEILQYIQWKTHLRVYLRECFSAIKWEVLHTGRKEFFYKDLLGYIEDADSHRRQYEEKLSTYHTSAIILGGASALAFALALIITEPIGAIVCKCFGLVFAAICCIILGICKSRSLEDKWKQRTTTFLRLDELKMDFDYETNFDKENMEHYIERMKQIIREDNQKCELYTSNTIKNLNELSKKMSEKV